MPAPNATTCWTRYALAEVTARSRRRTCQLFPPLPCRDAGFSFCGLPRPAGPPAAACWANGNFLSVSRRPISSGTGGAARSASPPAAVAAAGLRIQPLSYSPGRRATVDGAQTFRHRLARCGANPSHRNSLNCDGSFMNGDYAGTTLDAGRALHGSLVVAPRDAGRKPSCRDLVCVFLTGIGAACSGQSSYSGPRRDHSKRERTSAMTLPVS